MFFSKLSSVAAVAAFSTLAAANMGSKTESMVSYDNKPSMTMGASVPSGSILVHTIVAKTSKEGKPVFEPAEIKANVGEMIQFHFWPKNHSVVRSSFVDPCMPVEMSAAANGTKNLFSGFMPVSMDSKEMPTFSFMVNDTKPIWFYCSQGMHCQNGMVGVVNAPADGKKTLQMYAGAAAKAKDNLSPGQSMSEGNSMSGSSGSMYGGSAESSTTSGSPAVSTSAPASNGTSNGTATPSPNGNPTSPNAASSVYAGSTIAMVIAGFAASFFLV